MSSYIMFTFIFLPSNSISPAENSTKCVLLFCIKMRNVTLLQLVQKCLVFFESWLLVTCFAQFVALIKHRPKNKLKVMQNVFTNCFEYCSELPNKGACSLKALRTIHVLRNPIFKHFLPTSPPTVWPEPI